MKGFLLVIISVTLSQCAFSDEQQSLTRIRRTKHKNFEGGLGGFLNGFLNINRRKEVQTNNESKTNSQEESDEHKDGFNFFKELNIQIGTGLDAIKKQIEYGMNFGKEFGLNLNINLGSKRKTSKPRSRTTPAPTNATTKSTTTYENGNKGINETKVPEVNISETETEVSVTIAQTMVSTSDKNNEPYSESDIDGSNKLDLRNNDNV